MSHTDTFSHNPKAFLLKHLSPLFISSLLFITACSDPYGEPNDRIEEAAFLPDGEAIEMKIDSTGDRDWYGMKVEGAGYLKLAVKKVPKELNLRLRFAAQQEWKASERKWLGEWSEFPVTRPFRDRDTVFFAVENADPGRSSEKPFLLKARFIEEFDPYEPNDGGEEVSEIELGTSIESYIYPEGDRDFFKVEVEEQGYLVARAETEPEGLEAEVRFLRMGTLGSEAEVISGYRSMPAAASVQGSGTYHVEVGGRENEGASRSPVKWKLSFLEEMDSTEPNARWMDAHPLKKGQNVLEVALFPVGDRDLFRIPSGAARRIEVKAKGQRGVDPQVRCLVDEGGYQKELSGWKGLPASFELEEGELHYLVMRDKEDNDASERPFLLRIEEDPL